MIARAQGIVKGNRRQRKGAAPQAKCSRPAPVPPQRLILRSYCGFAGRLCNSQPCPVASGGPLSLSGKERGKRNRQREPISRRFPLDSFPDDQGGSGPHWIPQEDTKDEGKRSLPPKHLPLF